MGNEACVLGEIEKDLDAENKQLDELINRLNKKDEVFESAAKNIQRQIFKNNDIANAFDFDKISTMSKDEKQKAQENYATYLSKNKALVDAVTSQIAGIAGMGSVAKYAFKAHTANISIEQLGFERVSTDDPKCLSYHLKNKSLEIVNMQAKWEGMGNIQLTLTLKNNSNKKMKVCIESGDVFEGPLKEQSAMVSETKGMEIEPGGQISECITCCCMNQDLSGPSGSNFRPTLLKLGIASDIIEKYEEKIKNIADKAKQNEQKCNMQRDLWKKVTEHTQKIISADASLKYSA